MKKITLGCVCLLALVQLAACNTVAGVGKDLEKGGEAIQKASQK